MRRVSIAVRHQKDSLRRCRCLSHAYRSAPPGIGHHPPCVWASPFWSSFTRPRGAFNDRGMHTSESSNVRENRSPLTAADECITGNYSGVEELLKVSIRAQPLLCWKKYSASISLSLLTGLTHYVHIYDINLHLPLLQRRLHITLVW